ncbi:MAG: hypothetical protein Q8936_03500 [Bacillota bacterium]|nr:hypothetical protein [Bacillota bacterium]
MAVVIMWLTLVLPWASMLFLDQYKIRKYMPVSLLACVSSTLINQIAWAYKWWYYKPIFGWDKVIPVYMIYGIFFVGTLWIFVVSYGKFWLYIIVNFLVDLFFGLVFEKMLTHFGIRTSGSLSVIQDLMLMTVQGIILYGYQMWQERIFKEVKVNEK